MLKPFLSSVFLLTAAIAGAASPQDFAGKWAFDPSQSKNIGMMSQASITTVIVQNKDQVIVDDISTMNGQSDTQRTVYELNGQPTVNTSMMTGKATTRSHWDGHRLITEWVNPSAIAGKTDKRIEQRYLSPDGNTMYEESAREGRPAILIVFTRTR